MPNNYMTYENAQNVLGNYATEINKKAAVFTGSNADWNLLSADEKKAYDFTAFPEDGDSGEDFTPAEKTKLSGIDSGATANTVINTTCTLTVAGWIGESAPYTQTVNVSGVLSTDVAICDVSVSSTVETGISQMEDWALISSIDSGTGTLIFSCYEEKPTTELTVTVHIVR